MARKTGGGSSISGMWTGTSPQLCRIEKRIRILEKANRMKAKGARDLERRTQRPLGFPHISVSGAKMNRWRAAWRSSGVAHREAVVVPGDKARGAHRRRKGVSVRREAVANEEQHPEPSKGGLDYFRGSLGRALRRLPGGDETGSKEEQLNGRTEA
ncbi:hypothetical protein K438DRAFT_1782227 [Mycena galopus ATCC 62051]|nr:hypothetical protein K438DRAFT_1782227 [Mycena galopus ATCC 62051]